MNWLIDLGNSRAKWARWTAGARDPGVQALAHATPDFVERMVGAIGPAAPGARAWLASVADPALTDALADGLAAAGYRCERMRTAASALGVRIAYAEPGRLGVDRFLALLAAHARADGPWLLASIGSALTVDLLARDGEHQGGWIAPSPGHMREALGARFPVLTGAPGEIRDWAGDTADAVASGTIAAAAGAIERAHRLARERCGTAPTVLVSGGGAEPVRAALPFASEFVEAPVLDGLARLAAAEGT